MQSHVTEFDYGARPIKRVIQQHIENPLATQLLEKQDATHVHINCDNKGLIIDFKNNAVKITAIDNRVTLEKGMGQSRER